MYTVSSGTTINAQDVNQIVNTLQQGSGGTETGKYWVESGSANSGWSLGQWIQSQSRTTIPVSVSVDTSTVLAGVSGVSTQNLTSSGFAIGAGATGVSNTARYAGNFTIQY